MAANVGFRAVECQRPYDVPATVMKDFLAHTDMEMVLINTPPSPREPEAAGLAIFPDRIAEFRKIAEAAVIYAAGIDCPRLHVVAGRLDDTLTPVEAGKTFVENLRWTADLGARHGVRILIEPLNGIDNPGYFLTTAAQARDILGQAGHANLFMQYDLYHAGMNGEDIAAGAREHLSVIDHMQMAGVPGRHEPDSGDIDMASVFNELDDMGYTGWVGAEYRPAVSTLDGLAWAAPYGIKVPPKL